MICPWIWMEVSRGVMTEASWLSSKPQIQMSSGTEDPKVAQGSDGIDGYKVIGTDKNIR